MRFFYSFINFVTDYRNIGITILIIPGTFHILEYKSSQGMINIFRINIRNKTFDRLETINLYTFHLFTLNKLL